MVTALLEAFRDAPDARIFGIGQDGNLDCAAFVHDAAYEPRGLKLFVFLFRMFRVYGWTMSRMFARVMSQKPEGQGRPLELLLLGTRTQSQGQGLGRIMLQHIYGFAREQGYDAVVLEVARETPAFGFYLREGFVVDKELSMPTTPLCFVRRPIRAAAAPRPSS